MATSSDGPAADGDVLMTVPDRPPPDPSPHGLSSDSPKLSTFTVKFEFRVTTKTFPAPEIHCQLLLDMEAVHAFHINTNKSPTSKIVPSQSTDDFFFRNFDYQTFRKTKHSLVCVAHTLTSDTPFSILRDSIKTSLSKNKAYLRIHKWNVSDLDITPVGWLFEAHPTAHNRDAIHRSLSLYCLSEQITLPPIELFIKTLSAVTSQKKRVTTQAIHIASRRTDASTVKDILQSCFTNPEAYLPGVFIPSDLSYHQGNAVYLQYLQHHNKYLQQHKSIVINGLTLPDLDLPVTSHDAPSTIGHELQQCPFIDWITPTNRSPTTGRYLLSTNNDKYDDAIKWVDTTFLPMLQSTTLPPRPLSFAHPTPCRAPVSQHNPTPYSSSLASSIPSLDESQYTKPPNAWKKPISIIASKTVPTTVSPITTSAPTSLSQMERKLADLTSLVESLQQKLDHVQATSQSTIQTIVQQNLAEHQAHLDQKYLSMFDSINQNLQQINSRLSSSSSNNTRTSDADPPDVSRAKKLPRFSSQAIATVHRSLKTTLSSKPPPSTTLNSLTASTPTNV